jgi:hypothetical protein
MKYKRLAGVGVLKAATYSYHAKNMLRSEEMSIISYIHTYIHTYMHTYIYIYIYMMVRWSVAGRSRPEYF